jgi:hypothetical protein
MPLLEALPLLLTWLSNELLLLLLMLVKGLPKLSSQ